MTEEEKHEEEEEFDPQYEFFECCRYGDVETGISLLQNFPIDPCKPDEFGTTPIHAASANGLVELMEAIVKVPGVNLDVQTPGGNTPLHYAALNRNSKIIKILVSAGANPKIKNDQGQSPLFEACSHMAQDNDAETEAVDLLIGPDSEIPDSIQIPATEKDVETE